MGQLEAGSTLSRERSSAIEEQREKALDGLKGMELSQEVNRMSGVIASSGKVADIHTELGAVKDSLVGAIEELKEKERDIEALTFEAAKAKELEVKLAEREASFSKLREELIKVQSFESEAMELLSEGKQRIHELEEEIEKGKMSEMKIYDSFCAQTKQFEQTKLLLDESRTEIKHLLAKLEKLEGSSPDAASVSSDQSSHGDMEEVLETLKSELQSANESLARAVKDEKASSLKAKSLAEEVTSLKNELKSATEAEENSKKALDDLAVALKEVITEAHQAKESLSSTKAELEKAKGEVEKLKARLKNTEEKYSEAKKEADRYKNTSERLILEAEESLQAWNGKETGFVDCIKKVEDERNAAQEENKTLLESLKEAENMYKKAKDENQKLRDIMKQAINEANVAKEAANIAKEENSQLKDALAKKDEALNFLSQENENLKINEAAAFENIKELKRLFCEATASGTTTTTTTKTKTTAAAAAAAAATTTTTTTTPPSKESETDQEQEQCKKQKPPTGAADQHKDKDEKEAPKKSKHHHRYSATCLSLYIPHKHKEAIEEELKDSDYDSDSDNSDPLRGSIFDVAESPHATTAVTTTAHHRKKSSSAFTDDEAIMNGEEFDHFDAAHFDEEGDRSSRKKRALLSRFGDLIRRRSFQRKEPSIE